MGCVKDEIGLSTSSKKKTIAIIGAGVSGLQAARTILTSDLKDIFDVVIFEARDRIGGRAWTNHPWKFPLDFGTSSFLSPLLVIISKK
jgi:predicted NAD/FAD-binding protein